MLNIPGFSLNKEAGERFRLAEPFCQGVELAVLLAGVLAVVPLGGTRLNPEPRGVDRLQ